MVVKKIVVLLIIFVTPFFLFSCVGHSESDGVYSFVLSKIDKERSSSQGLVKHTVPIEKLGVSRNHYKSSFDKSITRRITITGAFSGEKYFLERSARDYVKRYPEVEIIIENYLNRSDYRDVMPVLLMSGDIGDIVFLSIDSNYRKIYDRSFEELTPYINRADFNQDNYFMNILAADEQNGRLFNLFLGAYPMHEYMMRTNIDPVYADEFSKRNDLNYNDLVMMYIDIASEKRSRGEDWETIFSNSCDPVEFLLMNLDSLIDYENKTAKFTDPKFMATMDRIKEEFYYGDYIKYTEDGMDLPMYDVNYNIFNLNENVDRNLRLLFKNTYGFSLLLSAPIKGSCYTDVKLIPTAVGNYYFTPTTRVAINKHSLDKELAWDFIKFLIADKEVTNARWDDEYLTSYKRYGQYLESIGTVLCVNRTNFTRMQKLLGEYYMLQLKNDYPRLTLEGRYDEFFSRYFEYIHSAMEKFNRTSTDYNWLYRYNDKGIIWDDMYLYLTDKQTVEQTMQNIENKVNIWLNE